MIESKNLSKSFGSTQALSDFSLKFEEHKIHAVLGENGAGKSTLMKLLFGLLKPTSGEIFIDAKKVEFQNSLDAIAEGIGMVQQHFCLVESLSAIDNIILGAEPCKNLVLDRDNALQELKAKLPDKSLHVPWHQKVSELSVGYRQRIEILKLMYRESKFLILDEPTAVLTPQEIKSFFALLLRLKEMGRTIVLITHKLNEVFAVCDQYHVLRSGNLIASGEVASATHSQLVKFMIGRDLQNTGLSQAPALSNDSSPSSKALVFAGVSTEQGVRGALKNISLHVMKGEILGVAGVEGSGQTKLIEALLRICSFEGRIKFLDYDISNESRTKEIRDMGLALIPEDRHTQAIWLEESCAKNFIIGIEENFQKNYFFDEEKIHAQTSSWQKEFSVKLQSLSQSISSLSGGNQQKLVFAREILGREPKFIICHQPTRGVDLGAIEKIHAEIFRLRNSGVSCLLISSELDELVSLSDRIYVLYDGKISGEFKRSDFSRDDIGRAMMGVTVEPSAGLSNEGSNGETSGALP